jgi:hypothetical protein
MAKARANLEPQPVSEPWSPETANPEGWRSTISNDGPLTVDNAGGAIGPTTPSDPTLAQMQQEVAAGRLPASVLEGYQKSLTRSATPQSAGIRATNLRMTPKPLQVDASALPGMDRPPMQADATSLPATTPTPQTPAELAMDHRRWYGSEEAGRNLNPSDPAAGRATIERLAPGPSRTPMRAELRGMDQRFQQLVSDERGYLSPYMALRAYQMLNKNVPGFTGVPAAAGRGVGILGAASAIAQLGTTKP